MLILFEGVDGSGKTTLMLEMAKSLIGEGYSVILNDELKIGTLPGPKRLDAIQLREVMLKLISDETIHLCDRGPLSDIVYRTFDSQDPVISLNMLKNMVMDNDNYDNFKIVITDTAKSKENMLRRGETNPISIQFHDSIKYLYQQYRGILHAWHYDYEYDDVDKLIGWLL